MKKQSNKPTKRKLTGIVYLLDIRLRNGKQLTKIGITTRKLRYRIGELVQDYYLKHDYMPMVIPIKQERTKYYVEMEQELLKQTKHWEYKYEVAFDGATECRQDVNRLELLGMYDKLLKKVDWIDHKAKVNTQQIIGINDMDPIIC